MLRSIGLPAQRILENQLGHDRDFHFCWYVDLYPLSFISIKNDQTSHKAQSVFYMDDHDDPGSRKRYL